MNPITIQYLIALLGVGLGLAGVLMPDKNNILKVKGDYAKHLSPADNVKIARMFGALFIALGVLIGLGTMAFGDLELF